jgi:hypothetical protein
MKTPWMNFEEIEDLVIENFDLERQKKRYSCWFVFADKDGEGTEEMKHHEAIVTMVKKNVIFNLYKLVS